MIFGYSKMYASKAGSSLLYRSWEEARAAFIVYFVNKQAALQLSVRHERNPVVIGNSNIAVLVTPVTDQLHRRCLNGK